MLSIPRTLALLFLLAALALAAPKPPHWDGLGPKPNPKEEDLYLPPGQPTGSCDIKDRVLFESVVMHGSNWNVTGDELKKAVNSGGAVTAWKFTEEYDGVIQTFEASFNLPTGREEAVAEKVAKLVKPFRMEIECKHKHHARGSDAAAAADIPFKEEEQE